VRCQRAQIKRDLRLGRCSPAALLRDPPSFMATAKVLDVLLSVPKYGPVKADKLLRCCRIAPNKTVAGLTDRQRIELAAHFTSQ